MVIKHENVVCEILCDSGWLGQDGANAMLNTVNLDSVFEQSGSSKAGDTSSAQCCAEADVQFHLLRCRLCGQSCP